MKRVDTGDSMLRELARPDHLGIDELPLGSWLVAPRRGYAHHGIYIGAGRVVHYAGLSRGWRRGPVEIVSVVEFCSGEKLWMKSTPTARYVGRGAAERALSRLGENRYRVMTNNCEHFCAWCLDGESRSRQVEQCLAWPRSIGLTIGDWLAHTWIPPRAALAQSNKQGRGRKTAATSAPTNRSAQAAGWFDQLVRVDFGLPMADVFNVVDTIVQ